MKAYKTTIEVVIRWTMGIHGETQEDVLQTADNLSQHEIEADGDLDEFMSVGATDIEEMYSEEDEDGVVEVEPERIELKGVNDSEISGEKSPNSIRGNQRENEDA